MNCKTSKTRTIFGSIMLVIGILIGALAYFLNNNTLYSVEYLYGISCGMVVSNIGLLIISFIRSKNPKYRQEDLINKTDERNVMISLRAMSIAFSYLFYGITICFLINLFIPLSFHYIALFFIITTIIVMMLSSHYYSKKY